MATASKQRRARKPAAQQTPQVEETVEVVEEVAVVTPKALAASLNVNPKVLRGWLRKNFPRTIEEKNTAWAIPEAAVKAATAHFTKSDEDDDSAE